MNHRRLDYIDTLRGLAAATTVAFHLLYITKGGPLPVPHWITSFSDSVFGAGVPLFFAISGFLLCMLMPSYQHNRHPLASFYLKRFFRIAPLFYSAIAIWAVLWSHSAPQWRPLIANVTFVFNLIPSMANSIIFAGWTVGVEMMFYLIFPLLHAKLRGIILKVAALIFSFVLSIIAGEAIEAYVDPSYHYGLLTIFHALPMFLIGMIAFELSQHLQCHPKRRELALVFLAGSVAIFGGLMNPNTILLPSRYWQSVATGLILLSFSLRPFAIVNPVTAFIGRISYSIYLFHGLIIIKIGSAFKTIYALGVPQAISYGLCLAFAFAVIVPVSAILYSLIEQPGNALGRRVVKHLNRKSIQDGSATQVVLEHGSQI